MKLELSLLITGILGISITCAAARGLPANPWATQKSIETTNTQEKSAVNEPVVDEHLQQNEQSQNRTRQNLQVPDISKAFDNEKIQNAAAKYWHEAQSQAQNTNETPPTLSAPQNADEAQMQEKINAVLEKLQQLDYNMPQQNNTANVQKYNSGTEIDWKTKMQINKASREYERYKNKAVANYKAAQRSAENIQRKVKSKIKNIEKSTEAALDSFK